MIPIKYYIKEMYSECAYTYWVIVREDVNSKRVVWAGGTMKAAEETLKEYNEIL